MFNKISRQVNTSTTPVHFLKTKWLRYAAAMILVLGTASYFLVIRHKQENILVNSGQPKRDFLPGGNKAILTLADGNTITLDNAAIGTLADLDGTNIVW